MGYSMPPRILASEIAATQLPRVLPDGVKVVSNLAAPSVDPISESEKLRQQIARMSDDEKVFFVNGVRQHLLDKHKGVREDDCPLDDIRMGVAIAMYHYNPVALDSDGEPLPAKVSRSKQLPGAKAPKVPSLVAEAKAKAIAAAQANINALFASLGNGPEGE